MGGDEVAHKDKNGHDDVFGYRDDVRAGHLGDCHASVGLVGCVEVDVVGSNTCCDGKLELFGFGESFCCEVSWVESGVSLVDVVVSIERIDVRCGDDHFSIYQFLIEL